MKFLNICNFLVVFYKVFIFRICKMNFSKMVEGYFKSEIKNDEYVKYDIRFWEGF